MLSRINAFALTVLMCATSMHSSHAAIVISDIELTATTLDFSLSGTIEDKVGANSQHHLYIAEQGNSDWILSSHWQLSAFSGTWTPDDANDPPATISLSNGGSEGDRAIIALAGATQSYSPVFTAGQTVTGTFSVTGGHFAPEATDTSKWVVAVGWNTFLFPDPSTITGAAVPEPASLAIVLLGMLIVSRKRRR